MMNFDELELVVSENYSFVGIKKESNTLFFFLPKGFDGSIFSLNTFTAKRDLFFLFYKILDVFKNICAQKGYLEEPNQVGIQDRDGVINHASGARLRREDEETENILYSKLDMIGHLINAYDEPKILSLVYRLGKNDRFDVSKIHRHLHQAIYLKNNAAYIDEVLIPRRAVQFESADIVAMYCYLYYEIKQQLAEEINAEISALAERFRQRYLRPGDSIFDEKSYEQVLDTLKDALATIDHNTALKDIDYWQYYEAIELFIYGTWDQAEEGEIWGIKNFHSVWESMCLSYLVDTSDPHQLLQIDSTYLHPQALIKLEGSIKTLDVSNTFLFNGFALEPDAVIMTLPSEQLKQPNKYTICADKNWNDFDYQTRFKSDDNWIRIAYAGQGKDIHTAEALFEDYRSNQELIIDSRLPSKYYSYWKVKELDLECLHKLCYLNHFFYLALEKGVKSWDEFQGSILKPLDITFVVKTNVFSASLFRYHAREEVKQDFEEFIRQAAVLTADSIKIVDVKYMSQKYLRDKNRVKEIKERSIRKQFLYEYLLQKMLEKECSIYREIAINSVFWIPGCRLDNAGIIEAAPTFMDGFIELQDINFLELARSYLK